MTDNKDQVRWFIEWTYSPADFLDEPLQIQHEHCELSIQAGKIIATVYPGRGDPRPTLRDQLHGELNDRFIGAQLVSAKPFKLSLASVRSEKPSGGKNISVELSEMIGIVDIQADIRIVDKDGNVIADSRAERIKRTHYLADLAAKHGGTDSVAKKILQSYKNAIDDPGDLLVHLYEIQEALERHFGGEAKARHELKIVKGKWGDLGKLANDPSISQSRHRGRRLSEMRDATGAELDAAMAAAQTMIENYLKYIDGTL